MKTWPAADVKNKFSEVIEKVSHGEQFAVTFGRKKEKVAVILPYSIYVQNEKKRKLGILENKGKVIFSKDFSISTEEFLGS